MTAKYDNTDGRLRGRKLQARRLKVWARDPHCAKCGALVECNAIPGYGFQLDHKVPLFKGGPDTEENCQVLCIAAKGATGCHDRKTAEDLDQRLKAEIGVDGWPKG